MRIQQKRNHLIFSKSGDFLFFGREVFVLLTGGEASDEKKSEKQRRSSPVSIEFQPLGENTDGFLSAKTQNFSIREVMSEVKTEPEQAELDLIPELEYLQKQA